MIVLRKITEYVIIHRMKVVLVFLTSTDNVSTEIMAGVRDFAGSTNWNIQQIKFDGAPFPVLNLMKFWSPIGCIVEASGNGLNKNTIPRCCTSARMTLSRKRLRP